MTVIKFWILEDEKSIRGYGAGERYEITEKNGTWKAAIVVQHYLDEGWGFREIANGSLFEVMLAVQHHAEGAEND